MMQERRGKGGRYKIYIKKDIFKKLLKNKFFITSKFSIFRRKVSDLNLILNEYD